jgi:DNA invertase Pin-like site-specific DNA recombinase
MTVIGMNENGYRIGMSHQNCTISQEIVDKMRDMHEDEMVGYRRLSAIFGIRRSTVQKICKYYIRAQTPSKWRRING